MNNTLYVGNLPYESKETEVETLFSQVGEVLDVRIVVDRFTQRSRGFGFVDMADEEMARMAIEELDGAELGGRSLRVAEANPRPGRGN